MRKGIFLIFLSCIHCLFSLPLPDKLLSGYWHNWGNSPNSILLSEISGDFDIINISFATPTAPMGSVMEFCPDPGIYPNAGDFINDIEVLHEQGKNVIISIGGANDPVGLDEEGDVEVFVTSMTTIITTYGFDGIDIDLEGGSVFLEAGDSDFTNPTTNRIVNMIEALIQLTDELPDLILTTAPETAYVQGGYSAYGGIWGAYLPIIHALRDRWDIVQVQHYNTGSMFGADGNLYSPATADFHVAMADMLLGGFSVSGGLIFPPLDPSQVAIGLPASPQAAGTGYTPAEEVQEALGYLITGEPFGGQYELINPEGYSDFKGLMTWSINWDADNDFEFSSSHRAFLDDFIAEILPAPENLNINAETGIMTWNSPSTEVIGYNIYLDGDSIAYTQAETWHYEDLVDFEEYSAGVQAVYETGESDLVSIDFIYTAGHNFGDIDGNGLIEALDASLVLQYVVGIDPVPYAPLPWETWQIAVSDVDGNGEIEAYDSSLIMRFVVGLIDIFPIERQ